jgi:formylglycine-generating enzyme required for sulfatase activity
LVTLSNRNRKLQWRAVDADGRGYSRLLALPSDGDMERQPMPVEDRFTLVSDDHSRLHFEALTQPGWADAIGRDGFGLWVDIAVERSGGQPARQRLRWIPPGWFWMGSPESEQGRYDDEGPQHRVTLEQGYWLFDTPCTQALWSAVMGENSSRFQDPKRPVERVSWDQAQAFVEAINKRVPGLNLSLPSEAQWEYACRAGTDTAIYTGGLEIKGENNAPALDPIAWYGGNSGEGFDLDEGEDSSGWPDKQYPHKKAGTREVGLKAANPWGLYDMLGNVWEWVEDDWHEDYNGAPGDGGAWSGTGDPGDRGAGRVVRGGCWYYIARYVRAAYRGRYRPGDRDDILGFRCARVQA